MGEESDRNPERKAIAIRQRRGGGVWGRKAIAIRNGKRSQSGNGGGVGEESDRNPEREAIAIRQRRGGGRGGRRKAIAIRNGKRSQSGNGRGGKRGGRGKAIAIRSGKRSQSGNGRGGKRGGRGKAIAIRQRAGREAGREGKGDRNPATGGEGSGEGGERRSQSGAGSDRNPPFVRQHGTHKTDGEFSAACLHACALRRPCPNPFQHRRLKAAARTAVENHIRGGASMPMRPSALLSVDMNEATRHRRVLVTALSDASMTLTCS